MRIRMLNGVGVVASTKRKIKSGFEFENYFPTPGYDDPLMTSNGTNDMTIDRFIPQIVKQYSDDTSKIAQVLKQTNLENTLKAVFEFIYKHIQYKMDSPFEEQIRRPARSWADRQSGVDCDCYTVFISSVLTNLRIPHYLRMTAYNKNRGFQHIYVVVPKTIGASMDKKANYFTVDPVLDSFDAEKPFMRKKDRFMNVGSGFGTGLAGFPIRMLNGDDYPFDSRTNIVSQDVYYSPTLDTWALKGLDGGFYIEGDTNRRFVEPLNGEGLVFVNTGVGVGSFFKKVGKIAKKVGKAAVKVATKVALPAAASLIPGGSAVLNVAKGIVSNVKNVANTAKGAVKELASNAGSQVVEALQQSANNIVAPTIAQAQNIAQTASFDPSVINSKIIAANKSTVMSLANMDKTLNDKIVAANKAMIMSLSTVDKTMKDKIDLFSANFGTGLKKMLDSGTTVSDALKEVDKLSSAALKQTANINEQQKEIDSKATQIIVANQAEKLQNETFRNEQRSMNKITIVAIAAVGVLLVYLIISKKNN